jgi:hypothetical protein
MADEQLVNAFYLQIPSAGEVQSNSRASKGKLEQERLAALEAKRILDCEQTTKLLSQGLEIASKAGLQTLRIVEETGHYDVGVWNDSKRLVFVRVPKGCLLFAVALIKKRGEGYTVNYDGKMEYYDVAW